MWLARASILLQTIGSFEIGLAGPPLLLIGGVVISALGFGFNLIVRAMIASLISHDIATLFSFVAFFETAMVAAANPLLSAAFRAGLKWGGYWLGLPFFVSGFLFMGALIIVACVSVSDGDIEPGDGETSETSETS
jgi:hypothetical protein